MKKLILVFLVGAGAGVGGYWFYQRAQSQGHLAEARDRVSYVVWKAGKSLKEATDEIKDELNRTGVVVRDKAKAAGESVTVAVADTTITGSLKAKLLSESGLRGVGVDTDRGVVTLSGTVGAHEDIARAMKLALETEGVQRVISKIQISAERPSATTKP